MHSNIKVSSTRPLAILRWFGLILLAVLASCGQQPAENGAPGSMFGAGPAPVTAITVQPQIVPITLEYTAQTIGSREVEVRAQVTGILRSRNYTEGDVVKAGQTLFTIDPESFNAALDRAKADLSSVEARWEQAKRNAARLKPLAEEKAVSQQEYDNVLSEETISAADVLAAKARVKETQLELKWTRVETPISGIAGRALPSEGSLISGPQVLLTTVTQVDPIHILFGMSDTERLMLQQEAQAGRVKLPEDGRFQVSLQLANGSQYSQKGVLNFEDVRISNTTGTSEARAKVLNPDAVLRPGQFVRINLIGAERHAAFKVPQRAVLNGPQGKFVFIVDKDSKAQVRPVETAEWTKDSWVIIRGLNAGDQVIVDGMMKIGPGAPVKLSDGQVPVASSTK